MFAICSLEESNRQLEEEKEKILTHSQILTEQVQSLHIEINQIQDTSNRDMEKFRYMYMNISKYLLLWHKNQPSCKQSLSCSSCIHNFPFPQVKA